MPSGTLWLEASCADLGDPGYHRRFGFGAPNAERAAAGDDRNP